MATPTAAERTQVVELYVGYFNRAPESAGLAFWAQKFADLTVLEAGNAEAALKTVANGMWDAAAGEVGYDEAADTSSFLDMVYQNVLGRTADAAGKSFWAGKLDDGAVSRGEFILAFIGGINVDNDPAGYARFNARVDVAEVWSQETFSGGLSDDEARAQGAAVLDGVDTAAQAQARIDVLLGSLPGETFYLTTGQDMLVGTSGNDTFDAYLFDNQNTLQSGDRIDGAGGTNNTLIADLGSSANFAVTPHTVRVQTIELRAEAKARDSGDNNTVIEPPQSSFNPNFVSLATESTTVARIDAERAIGVKQWINNNSRADLVIEDIRLDTINSNRPSNVAATTQISKDVKLAMRNTDPGAVDFRVYFEANSLKAAPTLREGAQLNLELMDTRSAVAGEPPLQNSPFNGFSFTLNDVSIQVQSEAIGAASTYAELLAAIQAAVAAIPALRDFTVAITGTFKVFDTESGTPAEGDIITLTNNGDGVVGEGNFLTHDGTVPSSSGLHTNQDTEAPLTVDSLVTSKIVLDNVGRGEVSEAYAPGSAAGDFVVGSMATRGGVERFEVEVQRGSWINSLSSTNNTLQEVVLVNGKSSEGQNTDAPGYVHIGASQQVNSKYGNLVGWQQASQLLGTNGLSDVRLVEASQFEGDIKIGAQITRAVFDKYLNAIDKDTGRPNADDVNFNYVLGKGNNSLNLSLDKLVTGDADFNLVINTGTGTGNNVVNVRITDDRIVDLSGGVSNNTMNAQYGNWLTNQANLNNIAIVTNEGDNTLFTHGRGNYAITTGKGDDTVYVDNSGNKAVFILKAASNRFGDLAIKITPDNGVVPLSNDILSVPPTTYTGAYAQVTVDFRGLTGEHAISFDPNTGEFTDLQVNQAIKEAINADPVLSKLLVAKDGPNRALIIESLIDGKTAITDLKIGFAPIANAPASTLPLFGGPAVGGVTPTAATTLMADYAPEYGLVTSYTGSPLPIGDGAVTTAGVTGVVDVQTITLSDEDWDMIVSDGWFQFYYDEDGFSSPVNETSIEEFADRLQDLLNPEDDGRVTLDGNVITITGTSPGARIPARLATNSDQTPVGIIEIVTAGVDPVIDVQTITLTDADIHALTARSVVAYDYNGDSGSVTLTTGGIDNLTTQLSAKLSPQATVTESGGIITITANAAGPVMGVAGLVLNNAQFAEVSGSDSVSHSDNVITITGGLDVVVLGTNDTESLAGGTSVGSNDTVKFAANAADVDLTIVDFTAGSAATAGLDTLDLLALGGSGAQFTSTLGGAITSVADQSVTLIGFNQLTPATGVTFAELTAEQLKAELNGAVGGIDSTSSTVLTKHVFLVADTNGLGVLNDNVFKVFWAESAAGTTDFSTVTLVGGVDLADTYLGDLTAANFAS